MSLLALGFGSRLYVRIPRAAARVSVSDTFVYLTLLLFGGEAATILAAVDAALIATQIARSRLIIAFNASVYICSTFATATALQQILGDPRFLAYNDNTSFIVGICIIALTQFVINTGLVAAAIALTTGQSIWQTWRQKFLWTSLTYFAGASAAGIIVKLVDQFGLYSVIAAVPIVVIIYFTYLTYLKNVEVSASQVALAQRHVEELSRYIDEQERIRAQFSQNEKMSALGQLASGVAHNFNNALASILARTELTLQQPLDPTVKRNLELVVSSAEDAAKTVRRIQDFARHGADRNPERVGIRQLLLDVSELTRPRWKEGAEAQDIHISLSLEATADVHVIGNASELREVLINMIFNALDAMPKGGHLRLASYLAGDSAVISVSDTGVGMSPETRSRVFDPFFTTKGEMGMGLGLAVSYGVISRHGGTIEVESEVGRGTTFHIKLPIDQSNSEAGAEIFVGRLPKSEYELAQEDGLRDESPALSASGQLLKSTEVDTRLPDALQSASHTHPTIRVLIVDDDPLVLTAYGDILLNLGYEINTAVSGANALEVAGAFCPDILLVDNNMPGMGGLQTIQELRSIAPNVLPILITGYSDVSIVTKALRQSVFDFLLKPISIEGLTHSVQRAVMHLEALEREHRQKDFLSIVSHELRAPLQAPLRYLENILSGNGEQLSEKHRGMLQRAAKGIKSEVRLINNLLDLQYLESGRFTIHPSQYSLRSVVHEVVESFYIQASDADVAIDWNPLVDPVLAWFDPEQIKQVIGNILNNAIQHTPGGGRVKIRLFRCRDKIRLLIRDGGLGIAAPFLERIFEKTFQIPSTGAKKGLGIGLYIAREIVRAHAGEIRVKSKLNAGSIFIITLPDQTVG